MTLLVFYHHRYVAPLAVLFVSLTVSILGHSCAIHYWNSFRHNRLSVSWVVSSQQLQLVFTVLLMALIENLLPPAAPSHPAPQTWGHLLGRGVPGLVTCLHNAVNDTGNSTTRSHQWFRPQLESALQVLAQLHSVTSDGDAEDEQQEDLAPSSQGKEHRRPHSAGNLVEQAAASSSSSHRAGRPPLAETTANNKLGLKVRTHPFALSLPFPFACSCHQAWQKALQLPCLRARARILMCAANLQSAASSCSTHCRHSFNTQLVSSPFVPPVAGVDQQDVAKKYVQQVAYCICVQQQM